MSKRNPQGHIAQNSVLPFQENGTQPLLDYVGLLSLRFNYADGFIFLQKTRKKKFRFVYYVFCFVFIKSAVRHKENIKTKQNCIYKLVFHLCLLEGKTYILELVYA